MAPLPHPPAARETADGKPPLPAGDCLISSALRHIPMPSSAARRRPAKPPLAALAGELWGLQAAMAAAVERSGRAMVAAVAGDGLLATVLRIPAEFQRFCQARPSPPRPPNPSPPECLPRGEPDLDSFSGELQELRRPELPVGAGLRRRAAGGLGGGPRGGQRHHQFLEHLQHPARGPAGADLVPQRSAGGGLPSQVRRRCCSAAAGCSDR